MARIIYVHFDEKAANNESFIVRIQGHPNHALELAHNVGRMIFHTRWRFGLISYTPPNDYELADAGITQCYIRRINQN